MDALFFNPVAGALNADYDVLLRGLRAVWGDTTIKPDSDARFPWRISVKPSNKPVFHVDLGADMITTDAPPDAQAQIAALLRASMPAQLEQPLWMTPEDASRKRELPFGVTASEIWDDNAWSEMTEQDFSGLGPPVVW